MPHGGPHYPVGPGGLGSSPPGSGPGGGLFGSGYIDWTLDPTYTGAPGSINIAGQDSSEDTTSVIDYMNPPNQGPWTGSKDFGIAKWNPGAENLINWLETEGMSMEDIAFGYGFEADDIGYFADWDTSTRKLQPGGFFDQEEEIAGDKLTLALKNAISGFEGVVDTAQDTAGQTLYEAYESSRGRTTQAGFTGQGQRTRDRAVHGAIGTYEKNVSGEQKSLEKTEETAEWTKADKMRDIRESRSDVKYDWYDELMQSLSTAVGQHGLTQRKHARNPSDYTRSGNGNPVEDSSWFGGDAHGDSYVDLETGDVWYYDDQWGPASNGEWVTAEAWAQR